MPEPQAGEPKAWLKHAKSDLLIASNRTSEEILLDTLCCHAQQAAEKSIKALLVKDHLEVPKTHNIKLLMETLSSQLIIPPEINAASILTDYAITARYPGEWEKVNAEEYKKAIELANKVYDWSAALIG